MFLLRVLKTIGFVSFDVCGMRPLQLFHAEITSLQLRLSTDCSVANAVVNIREPGPIYEAQALVSFPLYAAVPRAVRTGCKPWLAVMTDLGLSFFFFSHVHVLWLKLQTQPTSLRVGLQGSVSLKRNLSMAQKLHGLGPRAPRVMCPAHPLMIFRGSDMRYQSATEVSRSSLEHVERSQCLQLQRLMFLHFLDKFSALHVLLAVA